METVTSADGTEIAYDRVGAGQRVVCLHGTGVTRRIWTGLVSELLDEVTLVVPDRRGRGDSGDADEWEIGREVADVRALVEATDDVGSASDTPEGQQLPIFFGSSFGGLLAMTAAQEIDVAGLVLYEPPMPGETVPEAERESLATGMETLMADGLEDEAVKLFFREAVGIDDLEATPLWPAASDLAASMAREARFVEAFRVDDVAVGVPTLLLTGEHTQEYQREGVALLAEAIPDATVREISGAGHAGVATRPGEVARAVNDFLG